MTEAATDRRSPLHDEHVALGAALTSFAGWQMPLRYTSDLAEHTAVRTAAGLFDLSHMGEIVVSGPDAGAFLDRALVGALSALKVLGARYTMVVQEDGGVIDDLVVYRTTPHDYLVVANASNHETVLAELRERAAGLDVEVADRSAATGLVAVQGPRALDVVLATAGLEADPDAPTELTPATSRYYACLPMRFAGAPVLLARTGYTGEDGFEFFLPAGHAPALWRALLAGGAPHGLVPAGLSARDSLRLEAGMPLYGNELDRTTTPHDAGLGRVVKLDKVDADGAPVPFVGRAALAARATSAPARVLVGLQGLGRRAARHGYAVHASTAPDAPAVGTVTSGAPSPTLGHPVAMAYVTPEVSAEGTELAVDVRGRREPVRVVPLPFYRRPR
ncbi:glycine cleavage system aminomethyltransferase GcvT [Cellulomonas shaoxiangyii]|uniref:Aminomethyltransferase n=1 Tax=Cellulomonas shaoxiangyii TaxID=2566013 RepID=A0A4P7SPY8_9CELL|nr:glycine cleavage system aminomethyltransferase GcvT [Cellulomonas shaoxiangyii]QCB95074.1 glycine cleavage system aminomethyltransferase GcvT [Cellulomonas shaoxiangyii]TGY85956.1 glycine cleavage system aminomethyltransferase GcvT [Cellulomonas shaoxiangyii]